MKHGFKPSYNLSTRPYSIGVFHMQRNNFTFEKKVPC